MKMKNEIHPTAPEILNLFPPTLGTLATKKSHSHNINAADTFNTYTSHPIISTSV